jgi:hypothetical protein
MIWSSPKRYYKCYQENDRRLIARFAWFPVYIKNREIKIWFQRYYILQGKYKESRWLHGVSGATQVSRLVWKDIELFLTISDLKKLLMVEKIKAKLNKEQWNRFLAKRKDKNGKAATLMP